MNSQTISSAPDPTRRGGAQPSYRVILSFLKSQQPKVLPWIVVSGIYFEIVLAAGDRREVALAFVTFQTLLTSGLLFRQAFTGRAWPFCPTLGLLGVLALGLALAIGFQFLPFAGAISGTAWRAVAGAVPAITLDRFASAVEAAKLSGLAALLLCGMVLAGSPESIKATMAALLFEGGLYVLWVCAAYYFPALGAVTSGDHRLVGTLPTPNACAALMGIIALLSWSQGLGAAPEGDDGGDNWWPMITNLSRGGGWPLLLAFLALWDLSFTGSRGGALATACAMALTTALWSVTEATRRRRLTRLKRDGSLLLLAGLLTLAAANPLASRLVSARATQSDRSRYFALYLAHLADAPISGFGLGTFRHFNAVLITPQPGLNSWELGAMHNVYLQWIYEGGVPGALAMFAIIATVLARTAATVAAIRCGRALVLGTLGVSLLLALHGAVDIDLQFAGISSLWSLLLGLSLGLALLRRTRPREAGHQQLRG